MIRKRNFENNNPDTRRGMHPKIVVLAVPISEIKNTLNNIKTC